MPTLSPAVAQRRAKVAGLTVGVRSGKRQPDDAELAAAKCDLAWERLAEHAESVVADWPTPTPECCASLSMTVMASLGLTTIG